MNKKKIIFGALIITGIILVCSIVFMNNRSSVKHTPTRKGRKGEMRVLLERSYNLEEAVQHSDLVVDIRITSWLGEEKGDIQRTYFSADVNDCFKGESLKKIILLQEGNSDFTIINFPLFDVGDRMIVFLKKAENYENTYWIIGGFTTILYVVEDGGELYAVDKLRKLVEGLSYSSNLYDERVKLIKEYAANNQ